ncbi:HNH endonuclease [Marivirga harenae]|uniref:HNH endonuclease n=1 Tax=Marivirga harenae TaxID=2010992 RepID=UPI0026DFCD69|nr:HNH endonuclease [Marivirga harenae]WKV12189.1 HNH endonuclease [Marivirga harenae]
MQQLDKVISKYLKACKAGEWIKKESYKFEYANYVYENVYWSDSNLQILEVLINSQKITYTYGSRGVQFVQKSGREKLSEFITISDIELFRRLHEGNSFDSIDWSGRSMSFTGLSAWIASLFPNRFYASPMSGFTYTISYLFNKDLDQLHKKGIKYFLQCQEYFKETERILRDFPIESLWLAEWNKFYRDNPELNVKAKDSFGKIDWAWLIEDFHLFIHREILELYKSSDTNKDVQDEGNLSTVEGKSKLSTHMQYERNPSFILNIKKSAIAKDPLLRCEVCGFSFKEVYGQCGEGFIEAHHLNPLAEKEGEKVTKKSDIALVCSNCHKMLHKGDPVYSIEELKSILK